MGPTVKEKMLEIYRRQLNTCIQVIEDHEERMELSRSVISRNKREADDLRGKIADIEADKFVATGGK